MLYLSTGVPGAGKTINTIKYVVENQDLNWLPPEVPGGDKRPRQVYFYGIRNLNPEIGWIEMTEEQALNWFDLPPGSVIIFDEAYTIFPVRHGAKKPPPHVEKLATHRHHGFDIIMICQKVTGQMDPFIRGLIGRHFHYARIFGSKTIQRFSWESCQDNPNTASSRATAIATPMRLDKKYFGSYHSADEHTHKANYPWVIFSVLGIALLVFAYSAWNFYSSVYGDIGENVDKAGQVLNTATQAPGGLSHAATPKSEEMTYAQRFTPAVKGLEWTAPAYAEVIEPKTWPRPAACMFVHKTRDCRCFTQQATKLDIPEGMCLQIVAGGFFDWTKEDPDYTQNNAQQPASDRLEAPPGIPGAAGGVSGGEAPATPATHTTRPQGNDRLTVLEWERNKTYEDKFPSPPL